MKSIFKNAILAAALVFGAASISNAQVKVGSNPATIGANSNLEVEATNGNKTIVDKATGQVTIKDGTQAANRVLTSDANGNASWQASGVQTSTSVVSAYSNVIQQVFPGLNHLSFTSESLDRDNNFNSASGYFTAPTNGLYLVNVYIRVSGSPAYEIGRIGFDTYAEVVGVGSYPLCSGIAYQGDWGYGSGSRTLPLSAGQQVRITFNVTSGGPTGQNRVLDQKVVEFIKISN